MSARLRLPTLPLRWRLTLLASLGPVIVLVLFDLLLYDRLENAMLQSTAESLRLSAQPFISFRLNPSRAVATPQPSSGESSAPATTPARPPADNTRVLNDLARVLTTRDITARTFDPNGQLVGDGPVLAQLDSGQIPRVDPAAYLEIAESGAERYLRANSRGGPVLVELIPLARPPTTPDAEPEIIGVLELGTSTRSIDQVLNRLRILLTIGSILAMAAIILLSVPLIRQALRPLRQMALTSRAIAAGDIRRRVGIPRGNDELTELAHAFNEMVARLEALLKTQRQLLVDASHELRTPLTALGGGVEMLLLGADQGDPEARHRLLVLMDDEVSRMGRLVDDLLTLSRFDTEAEAPLQLTGVDLTALLEQVTEEIRLLAPEHRVELVRPPGRQVEVPADGDRLRQALLNLCANARAHTPPGGRIRLELRLEAGEAVITVSDTGSGIAREDLPNVWNRFFRADRSRTRSAAGGGHGLGLSIVRAIVEAHHGSVAIGSEPGRGTWVTIRLPRATSLPTPAPAPAAMKAQ